MVTLVLTGCTTWDDPVTENYGDGPSISVDLLAVAPTDSAFNITLTPAAGSTYYAYLIDANDEAESLDASTLLKGGYGNTVVDVSKSATLTIPIKDANPNTTYQVYAVACNDKGIVGPVTNKSIKTSDAGAPYPVEAEADPDSKTFTVSFSESVKPGNGKIIVTLYKEWDITNPVEIPEEEMEVTIEDGVVTVTAPDTPAGAFLTLSWEEGAFVDEVGNKCAALKSYLNLNTGKWIGVYVQNTPVPFEINDTNIVSPEDGSLVAKYEEFVGKIEMPFDIYRNDETVEDGDVKVLYINEKKTTIHNLTPEQWSVSGKTLTFKLPVKPDAGDIIQVGLDEEAIYDVYGNPNLEFVADEVKWLFFAPTLDMILGTFNLKYISYWAEGDEVEDIGNITIEKDPETENGLIIKNLLIEGSVIKGTYDLAAGKIYIPSEQYLGIYTTTSGDKYNTFFASADDEIDNVGFTINPDGTLTSEDYWGFYLFDEGLTAGLGWMDVAVITQMKPVSAAGAKRKASVSKITKKTVKIHKAGRNLKKRVRK